VLPPGGNGTTTRTGLFGQGVCATATGIVATSANKSNPHFIVMVPLPWLPRDSF
jgi:hypothetical protein